MYLKKLVLYKMLLLSILSSSILQAQKVEPFIPEIVVQFPNVRDIAIAPSGRELFFTVQSHKEELSVVMYCEQVKGKWSSPRTASFSGQYNDLEPYFSFDGLRLYFVSNRALTSDSHEVKDYDIWYVERATLHQAWSLPINMGAPVNSTHNEFYPSLALNKNLYFTSDADAGSSKDNLYKCQWVNGKYEAPVSLGDSINSIGYEFNAFVAPDESFLLFTAYNRKDGFGSGDLYLSYNKKGAWTKAANLGTDINSTQMDYCPFVDFKSGVLYFTSKRSSVVSRFNRQQKVDAVLNEMNKYDNGQSRLYKVDFKRYLSHP